MLTSAPSNWFITKWHSSTVSKTVAIVTGLHLFVVDSHSVISDPDKWKHNSEHGMSRKEAENRFKFIQSAYDHLMSNFDD